MRCRVCSNSEYNKPHVFREVTYGWPEEFDYIECRNCGSISILEIPADIDRFYPADYYSKSATLRGDALPSWKLALKRQRTRYWLGRTTPLGRMLAREEPPWFIKQLCNLNVDLGDPILDVGCGNGDLLIRM